jgi:hypothetical protein
MFSRWAMVLYPRIFLLEGVLVQQQQRNKPNDYTLFWQRTAMMLLYSVSRSFPRGEGIGRDDAHPPNHFSSPNCTPG